MVKISCFALKDHGFVAMLFWAIRQLPADHVKQKSLSVVMMLGMSALTLDNHHE